MTGSRPIKDRSSIGLLFLVRHTIKMLYTPKQFSTTLRSREVVLLALLTATVATIILVTAALLTSYFRGNEYVAGRLVVCLGALGYMGLIFMLARRKSYWLAAYLLVFFYCLLAAGIAWQWGINLPFGLLMFSVVIVLAGILLGSSWALYVAGLATGILAILQWGLEHEIYIPDTNWALRASTYGDVVGYGIVFGLLAGVSWLFGHEIEHALSRAQRAEAGLRKEKALLASRVEARTAELQAAQFKEMEQLYQFAELGHLGTAMMHELANHLTVLTLDIEDLQQQQSSEVLTRARQTMRYLDAMVGRVRERLQGNTVNRAFDVANHIKKTIVFLQPQAERERVTVVVNTEASHAKLSCFGDAIRFRQIMAVLLTNAIDAYRGSRNAERRIIITLKTSGNSAVICVRDYGKGLSDAQRQRLFQPFYTSKNGGMGIGLSIAKGILETQFKGTIKLGNAAGFTEFIVTIPLHKR